jgi:hypothetical protein
MKSKKKLPFGKPPKPTAADAAYGTDTGDEGAMPPFAKKLPKPSKGVKAAAARKAAAMKKKPAAGKPPFPMG